MNINEIKTKPESREIIIVSALQAFVTNTHYRTIYLGFIKIELYIYK